MCFTTGFFCDATPFTSFDSENIYDLLENECGYSRHGDEVLQVVLTVSNYQLRYLLVTYYQRLKHMVKDKINFVRRVRYH